MTDPAIESVAASARSFGAAPHYLHTSPEFAMKRLLAAGSGDIYQLCRVFRDDELGRWHQPEFTLLEWYRVGWDEQRLMAEVAELFAAALAAATPGAASAPRRIVRITLCASRCDAALGAATRSADGGARSRGCARLGVDVPAGLAHDAVLDLAFGTRGARELRRRAPLTFVYDYPASQAALARLKPTTPPVAARFEAFSGGIELANGFHELADAAEQRRRFVATIASAPRRGPARAAARRALPGALEPSLPDCAGVALGFDRLVALATGQNDVAPRSSFAHAAERLSDGYCLTREM